MPKKAFVLIETTVGKTPEVCTALRKIRPIKSVDAATGPYDIIITVEGKDINSIGKVIAGKAHSIPGIRRTITCLCI
jgi:DNA-binding Lrp family transcriptional regulator